MSAWLLPDHIADVLPSEARHIEDLRRALLDAARRHGYELVIPPLVEHLASLLTGTGEALDLQTFKLVDQLSGRSLGLRADTTPQVARIDAHLLNRQGLTRLCYCGPVLHTRTDQPHSTREPLQFGAEIYGHAGREAELEAIELSATCLQAAGVHDVLFDLGDVRVVDALLQGLALPAEQLHQLHSALATKDAAALAEYALPLPSPVRQGLDRLIHLYGDVGVLDEAWQCLPRNALLERALDDLRWLAAQLPHLALNVDLADLRGYAYYTGLRFSAFGAGQAGGERQVLVRGGRYDEVGAVFGRKRPAVGFSLDLKDLSALVPPPAAQAAIRAPWGTDAGLRTEIARLRAAGETVVCVLPGHEHEVDEFHCNRVLQAHNGGWVVRPLQA